MDQAISREPVEQTTELALQEKAKLVKSMSRAWTWWGSPCARSSGWTRWARSPPTAPRAFTWLIVLAIVFVLPYALLMAEVGSAFTQEGGPYEWSKMAFGRLQGAIAAVLYWVTNPLWVGGSLAFIATEAWNDNIFKIHSGSAGDYLFKFLFIWLSIGVAIVSLKRGKWIPNVGAIMRIIVLGFFTLTTIIYAFSHGVDGFPVGDLKPTGAIFLALVPLLLFNYVGFELQNGAAEEMNDPQKDVPLPSCAAASSACCSTRSRSSRSCSSCRQEKVTGIGGFLDAVTETFTVYGGAQSFLLGVMTRVLRHHPADLRRGVDDRLGPDPRRGRLRRRLPGLLRRLQPHVRHADPRQHDVGHLRHHLHGRRRGQLPRRGRRQVRRRAHHRDLDDADLLSLGLPVGAEAALHPPARAPALQRSRRAARDVDRRGPDHVLDRAGQLRGRLPGDARGHLRDRLQLRGRRGASATGPTRR